MANTIIGKVYRATPTETRTYDGRTYFERTLILDATRCDQWTGEPGYANFPQFTVSGEDRCAELDSFATGAIVQVSFDLSGAKYNDKTTGEEKYFNKVRAYKIEYYGRYQQTAPATENMPPMPEKEPDFVPESSETDDLPFM